jgi:hypothetical protein
MKGNGLAFRKQLTDVYETFYEYYGIWTRSWATTAKQTARQRPLLAMAHRQQQKNGVFCAVRAVRSTLGFSCCELLLLEAGS